MPKKIKLNLEELNVKSFKTSENSTDVKGGRTFLTLPICGTVSLCETVYIHCGTITVCTSITIEKEM